MEGQLDSWMEEGTPERRTAPVCFDRTLLSEIEEAKARLRELSPPDKAKTLGEGGEVQALRDRLAELEEAAAAKTKALVFISIGRRRWKALLAEHPPTKEQKEAFGPLLDHNPETFPAVAMAATCVEPGLTITQARRIVDELPLGVVDRVWAACLGANVTGSTDPFVAASDGVPTGSSR